MPCFARAAVMTFQLLFKYCSRYLGNKVENFDSSVNVPPALSSGLKGSIFHLSISSVSHGLSVLCVDGIVQDVLRARTTVNCARTVCDRTGSRSVQGVVRDARVSSVRVIFEHESRTKKKLGVGDKKSALSPFFWKLQALGPFKLGPRLAAPRSYRSSLQLSDTYFCNVAHNRAPYVV